MKKYLIILILISIAFFSNSQEKQYNLFGHIYDNFTNKPVSNVHIKVKGSNKGTSTNNTGYYSLNYTQLPIEVTFTHVKYDTLTVLIKSANQQQFNVRLTEHIYTCPVVPITVKKPVNLVEKKFYDVTDYDFIDTNIVMLAYCYKELINPWLILMNENGDTLVTQHVKYEGKLYRDCNDHLHILTKDSAYKFDLISNQFKFTDEIDMETFHENYEPCITSLNDITYYKQYIYNDQVLAYYTIDENEKMKDFKVVADEVGIRRLFDRDRFHSMGASAATEADLRFEEMCFFDPIFAPLVKVKDRICILNYVDSVIEVYNKYGKSIKNTPINFHLKRYWKEEIYVDNPKGKVYTIFKKSGISTLKEIDLNSGKLTKYFNIPDFHFIEKIKIHNNNMYFLYRDNSPTDLMKLYKFEIY